MNSMKVVIIQERRCHLKTYQNNTTSCFKSQIVWMNINAKLHSICINLDVIFTARIYVFFPHKHSNIK